MADIKLDFDPITGWNDPNIFPTTPSKNAVRGLFQRLHDQTKDFINNILIPWISTGFATKSDLNGVIAGTVNLVDPLTGTKYVWGIENGLLFLEEVA